MSGPIGTRSIIAMPPVSSPSSIFITVTPLLSSTAHATALDTELYRAIAALIARHDAGV